MNNQLKSVLEKYWFVFVGLAVVSMITVGVLWLQSRKSTPLYNDLRVVTPIPSVIPQGTSSDEVPAIEKDLKAVDLENVDQELISIDNELSTPSE